jgi:hypothetical protein
MNLKRALIGLAVTAFTVLAFAGPASAAPGQVLSIRFHGTFADAFWFSSTSTSFTATTLTVTPSQLAVDQFTANTDASGNFTGGTDTFADVTTGFSFRIDKAQLTTASASGAIPGTTCAVDVNGNETNCTATTINLTVAWSGQGPIAREVANQHFKAAGFSESDHFNGTDRAASASGTFSGNALNASDLQFADLGFANSGIIQRCIGLSC